MLPLHTEGMPVVGNGGYLGAMSSSWLLSHFAPFGAWILTITLGVIGALLTTDYALLYASRKIFAGSAQISRKGMRKAAESLPPALRRRRKPFDEIAAPHLGAEVQADEEDSENDDFEEESTGEQGERLRREPRIKFRSGKRRGGGSDESDEDASKGGAIAVADPPSSEDNGESYEEEYYEEEDAAEDEEPVIRELEVDDETIALRHDQEHESPGPGPKIRLPKKSKGDDDLSRLHESVKETAPEGSEDYQLPSVTLLEASDDIDYEEQLSEVRRKAKLLEATFRDFGFNIRVVEIETGPVIAQYEIEMEAGLRLSKITSLAEDVAIGLRVPSVRIVAPIPGKNTVGHRGSQ